MDAFERHVEGGRRRLPRRHFRCAGTPHRGRRTRRLEAEQCATLVPGACFEEVLPEVGSDDFCQKRWHSITDELNFFTVVAPEPEINGEGLKRRALTNRQRPVFRRVKKIAQRAARNRLGRLIGTEAANSRWCTTALLGGRAIHHTAERSPLVTFVP